MNTYIIDNSVTCYRATCFCVTKCNWRHCVGVLTVHLGCEAVLSCRSGQRSVRTVWVTSWTRLSWSYRVGGLVAHLTVWCVQVAHLTAWCVQVAHLTAWCVQVAHLAAVCSGSMPGLVVCSGSTPGLVVCSDSTSDCVVCSGSMPGCVACTVLHY